MLKKVLRKLVTLTVTVATVATMAAPVSAATLTPKKSHSKADEYSCAVTPQVRQTGNRLSGLAGTAYASLFT